MLKAFEHAFEYERFNGFVLFRISSNVHRRITCCTQLRATRWRMQIFSWSSAVILVRRNELVFAFAVVLEELTESHVE